MNKLDKYLGYEFHKEYSEILYNTTEFHLDFMDKNNHLLMDTRDFPNIEIKLLHPQKVSQLIPEKYFEHYTTNYLAYEKVAIYLFSDEECFIICQQNPDDRISESMVHAQNDTERYIRAYKDGLVKDAYKLAKDKDIPVIFSIIDGDAKIIFEEDMEIILEKYHEYLGSKEDWEMIAISTNPTLVSFLYIDTKEKRFWYDVLSEEFESELFESWGWNYYEN